MRLLIFLFIFLLISNCNKPRTVLLCGDHVCVNKTEAEQYFEENLTLEVKILDKKVKNNINLVELNLQESSEGERKVRLVSKPKTDKIIKELSKEEIIEIKDKIKSKKKVKKSIKKVKNVDEIELKKKKKNKVQNIKIKPNNVNKFEKDLVDVCTIIEKCSIDEISKYLEKQGKKRSFPDITIRQ